MDSKTYKQMAVIESLYDLRVIIAKIYKQSCVENGCQSSNHCLMCDKFTKFNENIEKALLDYSLGREIMT